MEDKQKSMKDRQKKIQKAKQIFLIAIAALFVWAGLNALGKEKEQVEIIDRNTSSSGYKVPDVPLPSLFTQDSIPDKEGYRVGLFSIELPDEEWKFKRISQGQIYEARVTLEESTIVWYFDTQNRYMSENVDPRAFGEEMMLLRVPEITKGIKRSRYSYANEDSEIIRYSDYVIRNTSPMSVIIGAEREESIYGERAYFFSYAGCNCALISFYKMENKDAATTQIENLVRAVKPAPLDLSKGEEVKGFFIPEGNFTGPNDKGYYKALLESAFSGVEFFFSDEEATIDTAGVIAGFKEGDPVYENEIIAGKKIFGCFQPSTGATSRLVIPSNGKSMVIGYVHGGEEQARLLALIEADYIPENTKSGS